MSTNSQENIRLTLNVTAPAFKLIDVFDRAINLEDYKGKKVFIGFFRHAGCPFCNMRVHKLLKLHEPLKEKNLEMIFFFESSKRLLLSSIFHTEISPIPLIADPEKTWYNAYGIESSASKSTVSHLTSFIQTAIKAKINKLPVHMMKDGESINTIPAEFLIDEEGVIRKIHYAKHLNDRLLTDEIMAFAESKAPEPISH